MLIAMTYPTPVTTHDVLDYFNSRTCCPSSVGKQIENHSQGIEHTQAPDSDPIGAIESNLAMARVFRCANDLLASGLPREGSYAWVYPELVKARDFARRSGVEMTTGYMVADLLRAYYEFGLRDPAKGLMFIAKRLHQWAPTMTKDPSLLPVEAAKFAAGVYGDALIAVDMWVKHWNYLEVKSVKKASNSPRASKSN